MVADDPNNRIPRNPPKSRSASRDYVDQSIDNQRQYAESLFSRAEGRVKVMLDQMFQEQLQKALATIRPTEQKQQTPTTREAQHATFMDLSKQMGELAAQYYMATGMKISVVRFAYANDRVVASPLVYMA